MEIDVTRFRKLRRQKALSMRELADAAGLNYNTVWRLENGHTNCHPRTVRKLAAALDVDPAELVPEEEGA